jgi:hypothetical protein
METLRHCHRGSAEETCATVEAALVGTARQDDVCLLTAGLTGQLSTRDGGGHPRRRRPPPTAAATPDGGGQPRRSWQSR